MVRVVICAIAICWAGLDVRAEDWPQWRGPSGQGLSSEKDLPLTWGGKGNDNILWKAPLINGTENVRQDQNQSSPIVLAGKVFVTLSYWPATATPKQHPEHHVVAFQEVDGKRLWDVIVPPGPWLLSDLRGGYTAPTPAADDERIYALFGSSVLAGLDHKGQLLWRKDIKPHSFDVALGASPVLFKDHVLVICEMTNKSSRLLAFDKKTGDLAWSHDRPGNDWTHSTPLLAQVNGQPQLLVAGANALQGLDPTSGKTLWSCGLAEKANTRIGDAPTPVFGVGLVYADSGRGGPGLAVDPTGSGDVTKTNLKWKSPPVPDGSLGSPLILGDYFYRLQSPGVLKCWKLPSFELMYSERMQDIANAPSPIATADGRLYFASGNKSYVVKAGPTFEVLGTSTLGDSSNASPAVANGRLFIKGQKNLYAIGTK